MLQVLQGDLGPLVLVALDQREDEFLADGEDVRIPMAESLEQLTRLEAAEDYVPEEWNRRNDEFHGALYAAADCPSLTGPIEALNAQANRIRVHFDVRRGPAAGDHRAILAACQSGNADEAARAAQRHILNAHLRLNGCDAVAPASPLAAAAALAGIGPDGSEPEFRLGHG